VAVCCEECVKISSYIKTDEFLASSGTISSEVSLLHAVTHDV
jgi:hypothetical protein